MRLRAFISQREMQDSLFKKKKKKKNEKNICKFHNYI